MPILRYAAADYFAMLWSIIVCDIEIFRFARLMPRHYLFHYSMHDIDAITLR